MTDTGNESSIRLGHRLTSTASTVMVVLDMVVITALPSKQPPSPQGAGR